MLYWTQYTVHDTQSLVSILHITRVLFVEVVLAVTFTATIIFMFGMPTIDIAIVLFLLTF